MGAPNGATLFLVQDQLIRAIRDVDKRHVIFVEDGYLGTAAVPDPAIGGWTKIAYSFHEYRFDSKTADDQRAGAEQFVDKCAKAAGQAEHSVICWRIQPGAAWTAQTLGAFTKSDGIHTDGLGAIWCYKVVMTKGGGDLWGLYHAADPVVPIDPFQDTAAQMIAKTTAYRTEQLSPVTELITALQR